MQVIYVIECRSLINVREYRRGNQKWIMEKLETLYTQDT